MNTIENYSIQSELLQKIAKEAAEKAAKEGAEKAAKEAAEKAAKEAAEKAAKEAAEKAAKEAAEKAAKEATEKATKEATEKAAKEAAEKAAKESAEKAAKEAAEKAAKEAAEKAAKEAAEKAAKESAEKVSKLGKGLLGAGVLVGAGLIGMDAYEKSKKEFDKRNGKTFKLIEISNASNNNIKLVFENPESLKFYKEEEVEITNSDNNFNGKYEIFSVENSTTIILKYQQKLEKNGKSGNIKLFANMKNDVNKVVDDNLKKLGDVTGVSTLLDTVKKIAYTAINYGILFLIGYILYLFLNFFMNFIYSFIITAVVLYVLYTSNMYLLI